MNPKQTISPVARTVALGASVVAIIFGLGLGTVIALNAYGVLTAVRDVGVMFASAIAATGVVTTAFVAFQASRHIEVQKDRHERERKIDQERTIAEAALVTLHVIATRLDGYYLRIRGAADNLRHAVDNSSFEGYFAACKELPLLPVPFPLLEHLDTRFMRLAEQQAVRNIEVDIHLVTQAAKQVQASATGDLEKERQILNSLGPQTYFGALSFAVRQLEERAASLFKTIVPYVNQRRSGAIPDEAKLQMLLGILDAPDAVPSSSLEEARERIRVVASQLLREHVYASDVRTLFLSVAEGVRDEDSIPVKGQT